jgi:hypothetical protein
MLPKASLCGSNSMKLSAGKKKLLVLSSSLRMEGTIGTLESIRALAESAALKSISHNVDIIYALIYSLPSVEAFLPSCPLAIPGINVIHVRQKGRGIYGALNTAFDLIWPDLLYVVQDDVLYVDSFTAAIEEVLRNYDSYTHFWFPVYDENLEALVSPSHPSTSHLGPLGKHQGLILNLNFFQGNKFKPVFCDTFRILGDVNQHFRLLPASKHYCSKSAIPIAFCVAGGISANKSLRRSFESIRARTHMIWPTSAIFYLFVKTVAVLKLRTTRFLARK